ncbi:MAG: hypothetical protein RRB13_10635 [bacterium]|nr:hypothetical protein [bacterium]
MKKALTILAGLLAMVGCSGGSSSPSIEEAKYMEIRYEGRIYVIGSDKMAQKFHAHLPYTQTYLGLGPQGETVILENEKKGEALKARLLGEYCEARKLNQGACANAPKAEGGDYLSIWVDGRIYVMGSEEAMEKYKPHLPYTQTYLGLGKAGETVVIENAKKGSELKARLLKQFCQQNQVTTGPCA